MRKSNPIRNWMDPSSAEALLYIFSTQDAQTPPYPTISTQTQRTVCIFGRPGENQTKTKNNCWTSLHYLLAPTTLQTLYPVPKPQTRAHSIPQMHSTQPSSQADLKTSFPPARTPISFVHHL